LEAKEEWRRQRQRKEQSGSTSQAGELDSESMIFSFSVTTPTIGYSGDSE